MKPKWRRSLSTHSIRASAYLYTDSYTPKPQYRRTTGM